MASILLWHLALLALVLAVFNPASADKQYLRRTSSFLSDRIVGGSLSKQPYPFFGFWEIGCGASLIHDGQCYFVYI